jgi:hypothetical protein
MLNETDPIINCKDSDLNIKTELTPQKTYLTKMLLHWKKHKFIAKKEAPTYLRSVSKCYEAIRKQWEKTSKKKNKQRIEKNWDQIIRAS